MTFYLHDQSDYCEDQEIDNCELVRFLNEMTYSHLDALVADEDFDSKTDYSYCPVCGNIVLNNETSFVTCGNCETEYDQIDAQCPLKNGYSLREYESTDNKFDYDKDIDFYEYCKYCDLNYSCFANRCSAIANYDENISSQECALIDAIDSKYELTQHVNNAEMMKKLAIKGNPIYQYQLGLLYEHGEVVSQDYCAAILWYSEAAKNSSADAAYRLGIMNYYGHWLPVDKFQANYYFRLAESQEYDKAISIFNSDIYIRQSL